MHWVILKTWSSLLLFVSTSRRVPNVFFILVRPSAVSRVTRIGLNIPVNSLRPFLIIAVAELSNGIPSVSHEKGCSSLASVVNFLTSRLGS